MEVRLNDRLIVTQSGSAVAGARRRQSGQPGCRPISFSLAAPLARRGGQARHENEGHGILKGVRTDEPENSILAHLQAIRRDQAAMLEQIQTLARQVARLAET